MTRGPIVAAESYPGMAKIRAAQGRKTYDRHDFTWIEDRLYAWRAVALFGGLLLAEGFILWQGLTSTSLAHPGLILAAVAILLGIGALPALMWGYTEAALAFIGVAVVGIIVGWGLPLSTLPSGYAAFTSPEEFGTDLASLLALLVGSAVLFALGAFQSVSISRRVRD